MVAVIIKRRIILLVILGLAGLTLLWLGLRGGLGLEAPSTPGVKVSTPDTGSVSFEGGGSTLTFENKDAGSGSKNEEVQNPNFFIEYRLERDRTRGQQVEWLREVINNAGTAAETRQKAQEHLMVISRSVEKESELENLIRAKGFNDACVMVDDTTATAIVSAASLSSTETAAIIELISRGASLEQQKIVVINKK